MSDKERKGERGYGYGVGRGGKRGRVSEKERLGEGGGEWIWRDAEIKREKEIFGNREGVIGGPNYITPSCPSNLI